MKDRHHSVLELLSPDKPVPQPAWTIVLDKQPATHRRGTFVSNPKSDSELIQNRTASPLEADSFSTEERVDLVVRSFAEDLDDSHYDSSGRPTTNSPIDLANPKSHDLQRLVADAVARHLAEIRRRS